MDDLKEQCICIKLRFKLGKTALETCERLKTFFSDNAMRRTATFEWFCLFKLWETLVENVNIEVISTQVTQMKTRKKLAKS
jgi:hypothetical protein